MRRLFRYLVLFFVVVSTAMLGSCKKDKDESSDNTYKGNKESGESYLKNNRTAEGVFEISSGLQYKINNYNPDAVRPEITDSAIVKMTGKTISSKTFIDTTMKILISKQIYGLQEGLTMMTEGSSFEFYVPYYLAYDTYTTSFYYKNETVTIRPYSALRYSIRLDSVIKND